MRANFPALEASEALPAITMRRAVRVHVLGGMSRGNVGTIIAQRSLYRLLKGAGWLDVSVSTDDERAFKLNHPEIKDDEVYEPLSPTAGKAIARGYVRWALLTLLNIVLLTLIALLIKLKVVPRSRAKVVSRMRECEAFIDLNLELIRGVPISLSPELVKRRLAVLVIHKLFWSLRILQYLWTIFLIKSIFKKKIIVGPASFGPFDHLPFPVRFAVKFFLRKFVDLLLVREPYSAAFLSKLGISNYVVVADTALLEGSPADLCESPRSSGLTVGIAPAMLRYTLTEEEFNNYVLAHAMCLDDLVREYGATVVFLPSTPEDSLVCKIIRNRMIFGDRAKIILTRNVDEYEMWVRKLDLLIATRMHPAIIAARNLVPFLSIVYDHKQLGFLSQVGLRGYSLPINRVSYSTLKPVLSNIVRHRLAIRKALEDHLPKARKKLLAKFYSALKVALRA